MSSSSTQNRKNSKPSTFDISTRKMVETIEVTLTDPMFPGEKRDTGGRIKILSARSKEAIRAARSSKPIRIEGDKLVSSEDDFSDNLVNQTIGVTVGWNLTDGEKPIACTPENVRALYTNPESAWIQGQVQAAYLDTSRFFVAAKTA